MSLLLVASLNAQWEDTRCPSGGYVYAIAADGPNIFAGTSNAVYQAAFVGSILASGFYVAILKANNHSSSIKLDLIN
jgi:hypothetical protein